jgi:hypothetical protein
MYIPIGYWKIGLPKLTVTKRLEYAARMESTLGLLSLLVIIGLPNSQANDCLWGILQLRPKRGTIMGLWGPQAWAALVVALWLVLCRCCCLHVLCRCMKYFFTQILPNEIKNT